MGDTHFYVNSREDAITNKNVSYIILIKKGII